MEVGIIGTSISEFSFKVNMEEGKAISGKTTVQLRDPGDEFSNFPIPDGMGVLQGRTISHYSNSLFEADAVVTGNFFIDDKIAKKIKKLIETESIDDDDYVEFSKTIMSPLFSKFQAMVGIVSGDSFNFSVIPDLPDRPAND
ncbi:hypothetical protein [uncultured Lacticaseibacillus sp.]|uniref:hypothetical protein n=1 Tax=uncultured Lacticaseibacillus sp. TaxID=2775882 RepID=UPI0025970910|nr:hypothetical protein [uncultured Lacticaseibacillus sp.]